MSEKTAFIGLGVMGYPMAGFLARAGHEVTVYNRTTIKAEKWVEEYGGKLALTPAEASKDATFVFLHVLAMMMTCVPLQLGLTVHFQV